jgi:hypothetical protein
MKVNGYMPWAVEEAIVGKVCQRCREIVAERTKRFDHRGGTRRDEIRRRFWNLSFPRARPVFHVICVTPSTDCPIAIHVATKRELKAYYICM